MSQSAQPDYQLVDMTVTDDTPQGDQVSMTLGLARVALRPEFVLTPRTAGLDGKGFLMLFRNGNSGWHIDGAAPFAQVQPDGNGILGSLSVWLYQSYIDPAASYSVVFKVWSSPQGPAPSYEIYGPGGFHRIVVAGGDQYFVVKFAGSANFWGVSMAGHDLRNWIFYSATVYKLPS